MVRITYMVKELKSGGFMAYCPEMRPVIVHADTEQQASEKLKSVARLYLQRHPEFEESVRTADLAA